MSKELEERLSKLEAAIEKIENRNKRVGLDKAWEISLARKIIIALFTYIAIVILMLSLKITDPWINAMISRRSHFLSQALL